MKYVTSPVLTLGRDGMSAEATEEDFTKWVAFVTERIGKACGFKVDVLIRGKRGAQDDLIAHADPEQRETIREAKQCLWEEWCEGDEDVWTYERYWNVVIGEKHTADNAVHEFELLMGADRRGLDEWLTEAEAIAASEGKSGPGEDDGPAFHARALDELVEAAERAAKDMVLIQVMPRHLIESHRKARNFGSYPANGAERYITTRECAAEVTQDAEYDHVVRDATAEDLKKYGRLPEQW